MKSLFLEKLVFIEDFRSFKKKEILEFVPGINLIVGDNSCGKSTLIQLLMDYEKYKSYYIPKYVQMGQMYHYDTEKDNPRNIKNVQGVNGGMLGAILQSHFLSHGETLLPSLTAIENFKDTLILLDEPESGISIKNQYKVLKSIQKAVKNGCQVLVATHSVVLMEAIGNVLSIEHRKWMQTKEFLKTQK